MTSYHAHSKFSKPCLYVALSGPSLLDSGPAIDAVGVTVFVDPPGEHRDAAPVYELALHMDTRGRAAGAEALRWDSLLPIISSPSFCVLSFVITRRSPDQEAILAILKQQAHLCSAVESGRVRVHLYQVPCILHHTPAWVDDSWLPYLSTSEAPCS